MAPFTDYISIALNLIHLGWCFGHALPHIHSSWILAQHACLCNSSCSLSLVTLAGQHWWPWGENCSFWGFHPVHGHCRLQQGLASPACQILLGSNLKVWSSILHWNKVTVFIWTQWCLAKTVMTHVKVPDKPCSIWISGIPSCWLENAVCILLSAD